HRNPPAFRLGENSTYSCTGFSGGLPKDCTALPPFHEQRSLSSRTYEAQGIDVKTLLGHKTEAMSAMYGDDRGLEWKKLVI
ncbi:hypothetical protein V6266_09860, partial [Enterobacter asburiae]